MYPPLVSVQDVSILCVVMGCGMYTNVRRCVSLMFYDFGYFDMLGSAVLIGFVAMIDFGSELFILSSGLFLESTQKSPASRVYFWQHVCEEMHSGSYAYADLVGWQIAFIKKTTHKRLTQTSVWRNDCIAECGVWILLGVLF